MQVVSAGQLVWIYTVLFTSVQVWRPCLSADGSCRTLPEPTLDIYSKSQGSVDLLCRSPEGYQGVVFMLYRLQEKVDAQELQSNSSEVYFTINMNEADSGQSELFCCLYKNHEGCFSAFSPYLKLDHQKDAAPFPSTPSLPPPVLSVKPSSGVIKRGDTLSFSCAVPAPSPQSQSQPGFKNKPLTFLLLRTAERTGATSVMHQPQASQVAGSEPQPGVFTVGPVMGGEQGGYTCIYQITKKRRTVNSTVSNMVQVTISDMLPLPTLTLQQQTDVWHLLCTGSPSYPGAVFSLYLVDSEHPVATQHARAIDHEARFTIPVQEAPLVLYQCQYSVLLGSLWSHSEGSPPLAVTKGISSASAPDMSVVDWPLVLGSFSAVVLFVSAVVLMVLVARRKVQAAAEKKKKRKDAQFWSKVHARDHVVDLTLRRSSFTSQECTSGANEMTQEFPIWNPLSTFTPLPCTV